MANPVTYVLALSVMLLLMGYNNMFNPLSTIKEREIGKQLFILGFLFCLFIPLVAAMRQYFVAALETIK